jgi:uncharacterized membrane protein
MREAIVLLAYAATLAPLLSVLPLWVDEILQLIGTTSPTLGGVFLWSTYSVGATPLGYLIQREAIHLFGFSTFVARLPAALFGILSVAAMGLLARRLGLSQPAWTMAMFGILPLVFRYAMEARVYSQALFLSILSTLAFLWLKDRPGWGRAVAYGLTLVAGLYTMPFMIFVAAGHFLIAPRLVAAPLIAASALFLPWYLHAHASWAANSAGSGYHFSASWKTPLMVVRELSGGGYITSLLLLGAAAYGASRMKRDDVRLLAATIAVPLASAFAVDYAFNYFFAIRQVIFVLPALILLAAATRPVIVAALLLASLVADVRMFRQPREDWAWAARVLRDSGNCVVVAPEESIKLYTFFGPLPTCGGGESSMVLAVSPYTTDSEASQAAANLTGKGFSAISTQTAGGTRIVTYVRAASR